MDDILVHGGHQLQMSSVQPSTTAPRDAHSGSGAHERRVLHMSEHPPRFLTVTFDRRSMAGVVADDVYRSVNKQGGFIRVGLADELIYRLASAGARSRPPGRAGRVADSESWREKTRRNPRRALGAPAADTGRTRRTRSGVMYARQFCSQGATGWV